MASPPNIPISTASPELGVGVDVIEISRVQEAVRRHGQRFLSRVYTEAEQAYCRGRGPQLAGRFAAKEAISKALGTGIRRIYWTNIEILPDRAGAPKVKLYGRARARLAQLGFTSLEVSISHSRENAVAIAIGHVSPRGA